MKISKQTHTRECWFRDDSMRIDSIRYQVEFPFIDRKSFESSPFPFIIHNTQTPYIAINAIFKRTKKKKKNRWILRMKFVTCCCAAAVEMIFGIMMLRKKRWSAKTDSEYFYFRPQQLSVPFECLLPKMNWTTTNSIWALFSCCCCGMLLSSFALPSSLPLTWFSLSYSVVALLFTRPLHTHCI